MLRVELNLSHLQRKVGLCDRMEQLCWQAIQKSLDTNVLVERLVMGAMVMPPRGLVVMFLLLSLSGTISPSLW